MDVHSKKVRSFNMSKIRSVSTAGERVVQHLLSDLKIDYGVNVKGIEGKPDIFIPHFNSVIFINGCFWHCHSGCNFFKIPTSNQVFWKDKLLKNVLRDKRTYFRLKKQGFKILKIWECEVKNGKYFEKILRFIIKQSRTC